MRTKLYLEIHQNPAYRRPAYNISIRDDNGGYRICGPKFDGSNKLICSHVLSQIDAEEIRKYLDEHFPQTEP